MIRKILVTGIIFSALVGTVPVLAQTSTENRFMDQEKKLEQRYQEAKAKLQEKIEAFKNKKATSAAVIQCAAAAVNVREAAIGSAFSTYAGSQTAALSARAAALNVAWSIPSTTSVALRTSTQAVWKAYNDAHKAAVKLHNTATQNAWSSYKDAAKACKVGKVGNVPMEYRGEGSDMAR